MRHLETLRGRGHVGTDGGKTSVEYELRIYQKEIRAGTMENPGATIPGMKSIEGWVRPFVGSMGTVLTLEMSDGRTVKFFFRDTLGSVVVSGGIETPASANG
ncbi:MAG TPA: hypothetical protein VKX39_18420 [Bryobacteraceae bacterium]|nr:hypothetical protein [Bryobacteraceae bacterium]